MTPLVPLEALLDAESRNPVSWLKQKRATDRKVMGNWQAWMEGRCCRSPKDQRQACSPSHPGCLLSFLLPSEPLSVSGQAGSRHFSMHWVGEAFWASQTLG